MVEKINIKNKHNKTKLIICIVLATILIISAVNIVFAEKSKENIQDIEVVEVDAIINVEEDTNQYNSIYENVYYYDSRNEQRYVNYQSRNLKLSVDDIVWKTNAGLDKNFYTDIKEIENVDNCLVVNKYNKLPDNYVPKDLEKLSSGQYLQHDTKIAFEEMNKRAKKLGYKINDVSGYRSISYQKELYNFYLKSYSRNLVDTFSSRAGHSEHNTGQALDITGSFGDLLEFEQTKEYKWIKENAYVYGFIIRYPKGSENITGYKYEPWHIRYVGIEIATDMKEKGINTLEEYYEKHISYNKKKI